MFGRYAVNPGIPPGGTSTSATSMGATGPGDFEARLQQVLVKTPLTDVV